MAEKISLIDRFLGRPQQLSTLLQEAQAINDAQSLEVGRLQESMRELSLYLEDLEWSRIDGWEVDHGFGLEVIRKHADYISALITVNPTIKKAMNARVGYIWGRGVNINPKQDAVRKRVMENVRNAENYFSDTAWWALEHELATNGNVWGMRNKKTDEVLPVPLAQIGGWVTDVADPSRVNYWYRSYMVRQTNFTTGQQYDSEVREFIPALNGNLGTATNIDGIPINRNYEMIHIAANRQKGWILGIPDVLAAMFWAKAHKELFEAGTTFVKAQGRYAAKVVSPTGEGGQNAAATLRDAPRRTESGEVLNAGGTAVLTGGLDYQLMGKMSGGVDFEAFEPVAGLVAAGLGIPLRVLLADSADVDASLEPSVVAEMQMRQKQWSSFFKAMFGNKQVEISWPKIRTEPEYRRIQATEIANKTNVLHRRELRLLTLEGFGLEGNPDDLPEIEEQPDVAINKAKAEDAAELSDDDDASVPDQGVDAGIGKLSTGGDAKDSRNNSLDTNTQGQ